MNSCRTEGGCEKPAGHQSRQQQLNELLLTVTGLHMTCSPPWCISLPQCVWCPAVARKLNIHNRGVKNHTGVFQFVLDATRWSLASGLNRAADVTAKPWGWPWPMCAPWGCEQTPQHQHWARHQHCMCAAGTTWSHGQCLLCGAHRASWDEKMMKWVMS